MFQVGVGRKGRRLRRTTLQDSSGVERQDPQFGMPECFRAARLAVVKPSCQDGSCKSGVTRGSANYPHMPASAVRGGEGVAWKHVDGEDINAS